MALFEQTYAPYVPFGSRNLSGGEHGTDVAVLQTLYNQALKVMNPPLGPMGQPIPVTGSYDAATRQAVRNVQSYFALSVDGVAGPNTYFVFGQGVGSHVTYGGPRFGSRTLQEGSAGGDVTVLQNRLNLFRYSLALGAPADGVFGDRTATALRQFQTDAAANGDTGLAVDGVCGPSTFDALWIYSYAGGRGIMTGRDGLDVVFLQVLLAQLGFYGGRITGLYDSATRSAVVNFQQAAGISADGVVGQQTCHALGLRNTVAAPSPYPVPPIGAAPSVQVCCVPLASATDDLHPYGVAVHAVNISEGFESVDVVGNTLPAPSCFGSQYGQYAFRLTNRQTGIVSTFLMTALSGTTPGDWAGTYSPGVVSIPAGLVQVVPTPSGSTSGPFGPAVLSGDLTSCPSPMAGDIDPADHGDEVAETPTG